MPIAKPLPWKQQCLCLLTILFGVVTCGVTADMDMTTQKPLDSLSVKSTAEQAREQGQLLYKSAIQQLEWILVQTNKASQMENSKSTFNPVTNTAVVQGIKQLVSRIAAFSSDGSENKESPKEPPSPTERQLEEATQKLREAGEVYGHQDALYTLANMYFFGHYTQKCNAKLSYYYYQLLANNGDSSAQQMLGFIYSTGIGNAVKRDQAKALVYYTFAASGGNTAAEMTLGYRSLLGIGMGQKCDDAVYYYKQVAEKAVNYYLSGPPGGRSSPMAKVRLSDEDGGVYRYGTSGMSDKGYRGSSGNSEKSVSIEEVLQYWRYLAQTKADFEAQLTLGQVYYLGTRSIAQNFKDAHEFFQRVTSTMPSGKPTLAFISSKKGKAIGQAAGYLGKMYWRGEGVEVNVQTAYQWFELGSKLGDPVSKNGLGMMYMEGLVVPKNKEKAIDYFRKAANKENADAQVNLAVEYMKQESTLPLAIRLFTMAADAKHILAYWNLAQLNYAGVGLKASCQMAVSFYKSIAERGDWRSPIVETAYKQYKKGDREKALIYYMMAAEKGYEVAQSNVAYLLDTDKQLLKLEDWGFTKAPPQNTDAEELALIYWSRSANQNNVDSRVKMGDYYYRGIGTPVDYSKAAACYRVAAEMEFSSLAMWNLGWMYENGIGVSKDFHLAKRSYDNALATNPDAYLPVKLSLSKLYLRYYWEWLTGEDVGEGLQEASKESTSGIKESMDTLSQARRRKEIEANENEKTHWDINTEDELRRKYSKHLKQMEREEGDDYLDTKSGFRSNKEDEEDEEDELATDEIVESLMILTLCLVVGWLVYVRQFRFGMQREDNELPREPENREQRP